MKCYIKFFFYVIIIFSCTFFSMQPVKITDPHLVSSFFDNFKRAYLHITVELENKSSWIAECSLNLQVTTEVEGNICLVEHHQTYDVSISPGKVIQYTVPPVSTFIILHISWLLFHHILHCCEDIDIKGSTVI